MALGHYHRGVVLFQGERALNVDSGRHACACSKRSEHKHIPAPTLLPPHTDRWFRTWMVWLVWVRSGTSTWPGGLGTEPHSWAIWLKGAVAPCLLAFAHPPRTLEEALGHGLAGNHPMAVEGS